jgi:hypothetical protein
VHRAREERQATQAGRLVVGRNNGDRSPDHFHVTGVSSGRPRTVSLHLHGRIMSGFSVHDVAHHESRDADGGGLRDQVGDR